MIPVLKKLQSSRRKTSAETSDLGLSSRDEGQPRPLPSHIHWLLPSGLSSEILRGWGWPKAKGLAFNPNDL